jgi:para-nitrobenzyl esterase
MSETSRRDFMVAGAVLGIGAPAVTLAAVRGSVGKAVVETPASAIVETAAGKVRGFVRNGIFTFKGIPYGATTAGEARFQPPAAPAPWTQVRATMSYGPVCPQPVRSGWLSDRAASTR